MASSVWSESMENVATSTPNLSLSNSQETKQDRTLPIQHLHYEALRSRHRESTFQPSESFLTQHETPLSPPESGSPSSTFAASTPTKNATESGRHNLSIESNHQFIQLLSPDHNSNCSIYAISFLHILGFRNTRHRLSCVFLFLPLLMRLLLLWEQMLLMFKVCFGY